MKTSGKALAEKVRSIERSRVFDVRSEELPTWCPGCGYFGIHQGLNSCIKQLGLAYHEVVTVSGIGCAGRYPFFASTYGFHSVHGRALPTAMGVKLGNPSLTVYVVGGDGDGLAIGGGHLPHVARRNVDLNYLLFDNSIYGLTKGQPSPSSPMGMKSKASPYGSPDTPLNASLLALSYGASFVARLFAGQPEAIAETLVQGTRHRGFSFFHILTSCVTFDKAFKTWENLNRGVHPLPASYDSSDWQEAVTLVARDDLAVGVLYQREGSATEPFQGRMLSLRSMDRMQEMLPRAEAYLSARHWSDVPVMAGQTFQVTPLAQGEYNLNYLLTGDEAQLVLRVNIGTQIDREDQIVYEYKALKLLESSGVTPTPYFVDDTRAHIDRGVLIMGYLPGEPLDYERDLEAAADLLAVVHQVPVIEEENHLIREDAPLSLIFEECAGLLETYFQSPLADPGIEAYLKTVKDWADAGRVRERFFQEDPWPCIVNTEVNSGNFIVNRKEKTVHLVDWEMPRYGDPSQDLSHFCSPLTTLWKTRYQMPEREKWAFIRTYANRHRDRHLRDTIGDRVQLRDPFVYLRGISWSAMGWAAYQRDYDGVRNPDTWATLERYMTLEFIRSLFDPFLSQ